MNRDELVGSVEAANMVGVSTRTLHRHVHAGELPIAYVAPGGFKGIWLFERADVAKIAEKRAEGHTPAAAPAYEDVAS
jgi:predicted site-specific integrase-resolvase